MQAQQAGVSITGQNLANVNNPAYARQRVNFQTSAAVATTAGILGTGVQVAGIQQIRDILLDNQIRDEASVGSFWTTSQSFLQNTQTQLGEFLGSGAVSGDGTDTGSSGLASQLNDLFTAFQGMETDAGSIPQRRVIISQAQGLADSFNQIASRLTSVNEALNNSVSSDVDSANQLFADIAQLNDDISKAEFSAPGTANDLRDARQQKLENLAQLTNLQASTAADGSLTISVGGVAMVSGSKVTDTLQAFDPGGGQLQVRAATAGTSLTLTGGSIRGAIDTRDGALVDLRNGLNSLASEIIGKVNAVYSAGYDLHGNTGASLFTGTDAASMGVDSSLSDDPSLLQAAGVPGASGDNTVAIAVAQLGLQKDAVLGNQTFSGAYGNLVAALGTALSTANDQVSNHDMVTSMLAKQRDSVSGVSMEEEMTNLMTFQKAYQASAQIISTVNQMLETLVNLKR